jgi:hypothetical protein
MAGFVGLAAGFARLNELNCEATIKLLNYATKLLKWLMFRDTLVRGK